MGIVDQVVPYSQLDLKANKIALDFIKKIDHVPWKESKDSLIIL